MYRSSTDTITSMPQPATTAGSTSTREATSIGSITRANKYATWTKTSATERLDTMSDGGKLGGMVTGNVRYLCHGRRPVDTSSHFAPVQVCMVMVPVPLANLVIICTLPIPPALRRPINPRAMPSTVYPRWPPLPQLARVTWARTRQ